MLDHNSAKLASVECDRQIQNEELDILFMDGEDGNHEGSNVGEGGPTAAQIAVKRILLDNELVVRCAKDFLPVNKRYVRALPSSRSLELSYILGCKVNPLMWLIFLGQYRVPYKRAALYQLKID